MNINQFEQSIKSVISSNSIETMAELVAFAMSKACERRANYTPLDALVSAFAEAGQRARLAKAFKAIGVSAYLKSKLRDTPDEWRGITVSYIVRPKKDAKDNFALAAKAASDPRAVKEAIQQADAEAKAEAKEKRERKKEAKHDPNYWRIAVQSLVEDAAKHGIKVSFTAYKVEKILDEFDRLQIEKAKADAEKTQTKKAS